VDKDGQSLRIDTKAYRQLFAKRKKKIKGSLEQIVVSGSQVQEKLRRALTKVEQGQKLINEGYQDLHEALTALGTTAKMREIAEAALSTL